MNFGPAFHSKSSLAALQKGPAAAVGYPFQSGLFQKFFSPVQKKIVNTHFLVIFALLHKIAHHSKLILYNLITDV